MSATDKVDYLVPTNRYLWGGKNKIHESENRKT